TAVCRKCYVHPDVISSYLDGTLLETLKSKAEQQLSRNVRSLRPEEAAVLGLLQQRLVAEQKRQKSLPKLLQESITAVRKRSRRLRSGLTQGRKEAKAQGL